MIDACLAGLSFAAADAAEAQLLGSLGASVEAAAERACAHPAARWAQSGAMALTGHPGEAPRLAEGPLAAALDAALRAWAQVAQGPLLPSDAWLLGQRAACFGFGRGGRQTPGGGARLLEARDGWFALNLARQDDRALLPAWLEFEEVGEDPWPALARLCRGRERAQLVDRARLLGLAAAASEHPAATPRWCEITAAGPRRPGPPTRPLRVLDLTTLWAGPLCGQLLRRAGAQVVKLESLSRPDGARRGPTLFYDALHCGKRSVALDFASERGRAEIARLIDWADLVVESARPRALRQLGFEAERIVREGQGKSWLSITGYGRRDPEAQWIAFGDDAAVAAGLAEGVADDRGPLFCGDAIADPLTGAHAALAAAASWRAGGGHLISLALRDVAAHAAAAPASHDPREGVSCEALADGAHVLVLPEGERVPVAEPRPPPAARSAASLGEHTNEVLAEIGRPC